MNECPHAQQLSAYHDGELSPAAGAEMEQHLRECPACAAELARLRELSGLLDGLAEPGIPPRVLHRLHRRADDSSRIGIRRIAEVVCAAAAVVLLACSFGLLHLSSPRDGAEQVATWETAAMGSTDVPIQENGDEQLAMWIVEELGE